MLNHFSNSPRPLLFMRAAGALRRGWNNVWSGTVASNLPAPHECALRQQRRGLQGERMGETGECFRSVDAPCHSLLPFKLPLSVSHRPDFF